MFHEGVSPEAWKKTNVVPTHTKDLKNLIKNYRPISLLPIFSNVFERLVFNSLFNYFMENKLFIHSQPSFVPGDSSVSHLLSITHRIYESFDFSPPIYMRRTFPDVSKAR